MWRDATQSLSTPSDKEKEVLYSNVFFNGAETYEKYNIFWHGPTVLLSDKEITQLLQTALKRCRTFTLRRKCVEHVYPFQIRRCAVSGYPPYHSEVQ